MATHPIIGSEFNDLQNSSWLVIGFTLAGLSTQAVVSTLAKSKIDLFLTAYSTASSAIYLGGNH